MKSLLAYYSRLTYSQGKLIWAVENNSVFYLTGILAFQLTLLRCLIMIHYQHANRISVALDCIIFGYDGEELSLLLIKRNFEPERGRWSLMGGFLTEGESLDQAANRILYSLTGLKNNFLEQLQTFGAVDRDPVERTISVVYYALVNRQQQEAETINAHNAHWIRLNRKPDLIFDHNLMVERALRQLRYKAALHAIGFELMPERFTIPQVQKLYEAIYNTELDRRNFSRKIRSTNLLVNTGEKDTNSTTKKGQLYQLNTENYQRYLQECINFFPELTLI